jgi:hypothetical protein
MAKGKGPDDGESRKNVALRELKWKELMSRVDAYRFYIQLILGVNGFFYATTGAVILFSLKDGATVGVSASSMRSIPFNSYLFLLLPILIGTVVGGFMTYAAGLQEHNERIINGIRRDLSENYDMQVSEIPDLKLLRKLLLVFGMIFFIVAAALCVVLSSSLSWVSSNSVWGRTGAVAGIGIVIVGPAFSIACACRYTAAAKKFSLARSRRRREKKLS